MGLFGQPKRKDPKEQVREWNSQLRKEGRKLDRQIHSIQREEEKAKRQLKDYAKKGQKDACSVLAKEVVRSRKAISRIHAAKAQLKSVEYGMNAQLGTLRVAGCFEKSAEVMKSMQQLIKVQDVNMTMRELSKEMMKAGIIEEMMEDTFESLEDQDDLEEEAQEEVDKVLWELTKGEIGKAPEAVNDTLPTLSEPELEGATGGEEEEVTEMQARLEALRS